MPVEVRTLKFDPDADWKQMSRSARIVTTAIVKSLEHVQMYSSAQVAQPTPIEKQMYRSGHIVTTGIY